jgi:hypothetical protein
MTNTTTFDITEKDGIIYFSVDEDDFSDEEISWHSCEIFHPTLAELMTLYFSIGGLLDQKGVMSYR